MSRPFRRRQAQTKGGPVKVTKADGSVEWHPPMKPTELKAFLERTEPRGWQGSRARDHDPPPPQG